MNCLSHNNKSYVELIKMKTSHLKVSSTCRSAIPTKKSHPHKQIDYPSAPIEKKKLYHNASTDKLTANDSTIRQHTHTCKPSYTKHKPKISRTKSEFTRSTHIEHKTHTKHSRTPSSSYKTIRLNHLLNDNNNNNIQLYKSFETLYTKFNIDKHIHLNINDNNNNNNNKILNDINKIDYNKIFTSYPQLECFIHTLISKLKHEITTRCILEEKTLHLLSNNNKQRLTLEKRLLKYKSISISK